MPQPRMGQIGQKESAPVMNQMPTSKEADADVRGEVGCQLVAIAVTVARGAHAVAATARADGRPARGQRREVDDDGVELAARARRVDKVEPLGGLRDVEPPLAGVVAEQERNGLALGIGGPQLGPRGRGVGAGEKLGYVSRSRRRIACRAQRVAVAQRRLGMTMGRSTHETVLVAGRSDSAL